MAVLNCAMVAASTLIIVGGSAWLAFALLVRWIERGSVRAPYDLLRAGALVRAMQLLARWVHRVRTVGLAEALRTVESARRDGRPVLIVANHTAWIDPLLIQAVLPFEVRWVMGADMAQPRHMAFWNYARVILIDRRVNESGPLREAIRHLKSGGGGFGSGAVGGGGVVGIFPEGFIERPPRVILPFKEGVGLVISRSGALVLPVVIDGTPQVEPGHRALWTPSRSRLRFLPALDYTSRKGKAGTWGAGEIAADLRRVFLDATGWPASERTPRWVNGAWTEIGLDGVEVVAPEPQPGTEVVRA